MRILVESSGSLISAFMINAIQDCGYQAFASDVDSDCHGRFLADGFVQFPKKNDPKLWQKIKKLTIQNRRLNHQRHAA